MFAANSLAGGGAERVVVRILRHLDRERFEPSLALLIKEGAFLEELPRDIRIHDLGRYGEGGRIGWFFNYLRILREQKPDVVFSFMWFMNAVSIVARALFLRNCKLIASERMSLHGKENPVDDFLRRFCIRHLYFLADRVVPNSMEMSRQLSEYGWFLKGNKISPIFNPVDIDTIRTMADRSESAAFPECDLPVVAGMGRMNPIKGFDVLIRAMGISQERFKLVLIGEDGGKDELNRLAVRLGLSERVAMTGFLKNPYPSLKRAAVFVLSSRSEGFPNVLIEAMALGLPCVATRCPTGPEEIITDGVDGLLVPVEDPQALAGAIDRLLSDPPLRRRIGDAGRERARRFDVSRIIGRFEDLIEEVVS